MTEFKINNRLVGPDQKPLVIAEIGINHNGNFDKAKEMILDAHHSGCECVKFQCHVIDGPYGEMLKNNVVPPNAQESIYDMMVRCAFTEEQDAKLKKMVEELGMIYLSTPFSRAAVDRLERLGVPAYKIGSGECNNYPLIEYICKTGKPIILSTGMNDIAAIKKAVDIIERYNIPYALLHCTSMYPTPYNKVRLGALQDLKDNFPNAVLGLSDHSLGNYTCYAAVALGASILEKHFTSYKTWPGSDVPISITPSELAELIKGCNAIHEAMGGGKTILPEEKGVIDFAYACVVSTKPIKKGELFTEDNIWVKRPATGEILAEDYSHVLGKTAVCDIEEDVQIKKNEVLGFEMPRVELKNSNEKLFTDLDTKIDKNIENFVANPDIETYKTLYQHCKNRHEYEKESYLVLNGFTPRAGYSISYNNNPQFFDIEKNWDNRKKLLDQPYLKLAKFNIGDTLEFEHHCGGRVKGKVSAIFLSGRGDAEICYGFDWYSTIPMTSESNPYCVEKSIIRKIE